MARTLTLFESATSRGRVARQGEIVCITYDGGGSLVMETMEFVTAQKWASSKPSSGNLLTDRGRFLERISVLISRPGSIQATRGSDKQLVALARMMKQAGYDIGEWTLPPQLKSLRPNADPPPEEMARKAAEQKAKAEGEAQDAEKPKPGS